MTAKIGINQATHGAFDGCDKAGVANAVLPRKPRKRSGLKEAHEVTYRTINYSTKNEYSRAKLCLELEANKIAI